MKVKTMTCLITLGTMTTISKFAWAWEAEVLKEKFGGQCEFYKKGVTDISELPEAGSEFSRLQDAYGVNEDTKVSHVENTFGRGKPGIVELRKSIMKSVVKQKRAPGPKKPAAKAKSKTEVDPLLA